MGKHYTLALRKQGGCEDTNKGCVSILVHQN